MAIVRLYREGKEIKKLELELGREYTAGRADSCDFVLNDSAISRQHLKFSHDGAKWKVQITSRFAQLSHQGAPYQTLDLENGVRFQIGEFEFRFEEAVAPKKSNPDPLPLALDDGSNASNVSNVSNVTSPFKPKKSKKRAKISDEEDSELEPSIEEKTAVGFVNVVPFVRVFNAKTKKTMDIRLDGQKWRAGRAPECQIVLDEGSASRNHFEINKTPMGFQVRDLGSSNGTRVNGQLIDEMTSVLLNSGDIISIGQTTIEFQVRDPQFTQRLQQAGIVPYGIETQELVRPGARVEVVTRNRKGGYQFKPIHGVIGGLFTLILVLNMMPSKNNEAPEPSLPIPGTNQGSTTNSSLSKAQNKFIEDTYNLAENLFKRQKYEASLIELKKIHELLPQYKRSRELETYAQQAIDIKAERDEMERRQQQEQELRNANEQIIRECRAKNFKSASAAEACLQPVLENDPENSSAQSLLTKIQKDTEKREREREAQESFQTDIKEMTSLFNKALSQEKEGQLLNALSTFNSLVNSDMSDPKGFKAKAKTRIKELESKIQSEIKKSQQRASELASQEKFREALRELQKALDFDPGNSAAKTQFDKVYKELNKRLKTIYGDSVLEESLGNVEAAKQKWNTIIETDIETGEYYQKAKRMLKKYGG